MKLKSTFISQDIDDTRFLVPVGGEAFSGIARGNKTAAFIVDCLKKGTTEEQIVDAMCVKYDAPRETIAADVKEVLDKLRSIGAIEE
jgi:hypothetical protein